MILNATAANGADETYFFSPCRNGLTCHDGEMAVRDDHSLGFCIDIGLWNATIEPTYFSDYGGVWEFVYGNGLTYGAFCPKFICDENVDVQMDPVSDSSPYWYHSTIHTKYACQNGTTSTTTTTTTSGPEHACSWRVGDHTLNLTSIRGFALNGISDNAPSQL